jgi:hypothetical protein
VEGLKADFKKNLKPQLFEELPPTPPIAATIPYNPAPCGLKSLHPYGLLHLVPTPRPSMDSLNLVLTPIYGLESLDPNHSRDMDTVFMHQNTHN